MKKLIFAILFFAPIFIIAQTNFGGLGSNDSGGPGFKTVSSNSNIVVSNIMVNDGTIMYHSDFGSEGYIASFTIKADGTNSTEFTFNDMKFSPFIDMLMNAANSSIVFKNSSGVTIQTMTASSNAQLRTGTSYSVLSVFDNGINVPINNVAEIIVRVYQNSTQANQQNSSNFNWEEITLANYALPVELTTFYAYKSSNKIDLIWQTATEVNNYGFEIERASVISSEQSESRNLSWEKIGFIEGHGNSNSEKNYSFQHSPNSDGVYSYRLKQIDFDGKFEYSSVVEVDFRTVTDFALEQNYPNPFNPATSISYSIPQNAFVSLKVYDVIGNEVAILVNTLQESGKHEVNFNASNLSSGIYFYKLTAGNSTQINKMLLVK